MYQKGTKVSLYFDAFLAPNSSNDTSIELSVTIARRNIHSLLLGLVLHAIFRPPKGPATPCNKPDNAILSFQQNTCRTAKLFLSKRGALIVECFH